MTRLFMDHYLTKVASLGSPGGDELRWVKPVRPGDTLSVSVTVLKAVPSKSKPDCGEPLEPTIAAGIDLAKTHNAVAANNKT